MFKLIALFAFLFGGTAYEIAPTPRPEGQPLSTRATASSQVQPRPIGPQTETIDDDVTSCLDPDGRIVPCWPLFP
jgi:hypothetical protein